jgi:cytochrome c peroxidase
MRALGALALLALAACTQEPVPGTSTWSDSERARIAALSLSRLPPPPPDPGNPFADDPRAAAFGATLFSDARLSRNGRIACASCHQPARAFSDGRALAEGLARGSRNTPGLLGVAWSPWLFWDGRADSLWAQAQGPLTHAREQGLTPTLLRERIAQFHRAGYEALFGPLDAADEGEVALRVGQSLAAFERGLRPPRTRFDTWADALARGEEHDGLSLQEQAGLALFVGRAQCLRCHHGPLLSNHGFHNTGMAPLPGRAPDRGRADGLVQVLRDPLNCRGTGAACPHLEYARRDAPEWLGAFKTPGLRQLALTAPYMHDGRFASLREVLDHYDRAPQVAAPAGHTELFPLGLTRAERDAIEAFLLSLSATPSAPPPPAAPPARP